MKLNRYLLIMIFIPVFSLSGIQISILYFNYSGPDMRDWQPVFARSIDMQLKDRDIFSTVYDSEKMQRFNRDKEAAYWAQTEQLLQKFQHHRSDLYLTGHYEQIGNRLEIKIAAFKPSGEMYFRGRYTSLPVSSQIQVAMEQFSYEIEMQARKNPPVSAQSAAERKTDESRTAEPSMPADGAGNNSSLRPFYLHFSPLYRERAEEPFCRCLQGHFGAGYRLHRNFEAGTELYYGEDEKQIGLSAALNFLYIKRHLFSLTAGAGYRFTGPVDAAGGKGLNEEAVFTAGFQYLFTVYQGISFGFEVLLSHDLSYAAGPVLRYRF